MAKDYDGQSIEVVRQAQTGLFMIRIVNLDVADYINDANSHLLYQQSEHPPADAGRRYVG